MGKFTYRNLAECRHHFLLMVNLPLFSVILHLTRFNCWSDFKFFVFLFAFVTQAACVAISFFYLFIVMKGEKKDVRNKITRRYEKELIEKKLVISRQDFQQAVCVCPSLYNMQACNSECFPVAFICLSPNLSLLCYTHGYWLYQTYSSMTWQFCKSHFWATLFFVFFLYYQHRLIHDPLAVFLLNSLYVAASN